MSSEKFHSYNNRITGELDSGRIVVAHSRLGENDAYNITYWGKNHVFEQARYLNGESIGQNSGTYNGNGVIFNGDKCPNLDALTSVVIDLMDILNQQISQQEKREEKIGGGDRKKGKWLLETGRKIEEMIEADKMNELDEALRQRAEFDRVLQEEIETTRVEK